MKRRREQSAELPRTRSGELTETRTYLQRSQVKLCSQAGKLGYSQVDPIQEGEQEEQAAHIGIEGERNSKGPMDQGQFISSSDEERKEAV